MSKYLRSSPAVACTGYEQCISACNSEVIAECISNQCYCETGTSYTPIFLEMLAGLATCSDDIPNSRQLCTID